jgi:hypothetical protein
LEEKKTRVDEIDEERQTVQQKIETELANLTQQLAERFLVNKNPKTLSGKYTASSSSLN